MGKGLCVAAVRCMDRVKTALRQCTFQADMIYSGYENEYDTGTGARKGGSFVPAGI